MATITSDGRPTFVKSALIVVDMQHDFVHGSLAIPDAPSIIDTVNDTLRLPFSVKIGTKDFHPPDHISFASTHQKPVLSNIVIYPPGDERQERGIPQILWPDHCVTHTPGAEFVEGLSSTLIDVVVLKGRDPCIESYSAFQDPWGISTTELPLLLKERGVTDVFLVGLAGDYCVKCTAIDAVEFGFRTWVIRDGVKSVGKTGEEWNEMRSKGIQIVDSAEAAQLLD